MPRSARPGPDGRHGGTPRLRIASPPVEGRANREVERILNEALGGPCKLVGGLRGRTKIVETDLDAGEVAARLDALFGPRTLD